MLAYDIKLKSFDKLDELSSRLIIPLQKAAVELAKSIQDRVRKGVSPTGGTWNPLGTYTTSGRGKRSDARWWVAPGDPQPSGYLNEVKDGPLKGWVCYQNYRDYIARLPARGFRTWYKTGSMWRSMGVRAMAVNKVKISFYGTKGKQYGYVTANSASMRRMGQAQVANWAGRNESFSVLQYNEAERAAFVEAIKADIDEEFAKRIGQAAEAGKAARRQRLAARRSSRLLGG